MTQRARENDGVQANASNTDDGNDLQQRDLKPANNQKVYALLVNSSYHDEKAAIEEQKPKPKKPVKRQVLVNDEDTIKYEYGNISEKKKYADIFESILGKADPSKKEEVEKTGNLFVDLRDPRFGNILTTTEKNIKDAQAKHYSKLDIPAIVKVQNINNK